MAQLPFVIKCYSTQLTDRASSNLRHRATSYYRYPRSCPRLRAFCTSSSHRLFVTPPDSKANSITLLDRSKPLFPPNYYTHSRMPASSETPKNSFRRPKGRVLSEVSTPSQDLSQTKEKMIEQRQNKNWIKSPNETNAHATSSSAHPGNVPSFDTPRP